MFFNYKNKSGFFPILFCLLCATPGLYSCKKLVEVPAPVNTISTDAAFSNDAKANSVMAGVYSLMMNNSGNLVFSNGGMSIYGGMSADELVNYAGTTNALDYGFLTNTLTAYNTSVNSIIWQPAYKVIYGANAVITNMAASTSTQLDDSTKKQLTGEAKFVRAFCYFYLTNLFGDVPLALSTDFNQTALMSRTAQADVYKQVVQDLKDAQGLLATDYSAGLGERIRANKWAATALLARVYLYQKDWADAEAQADSVIGNSQFSIVSNLNNVFLKNSTETILQLQQNNTIKPYNTTWEGADFVPQFRWSTLAPSDKATFLIPSFYAAYGSFLIPPYYLTAQAISAFEPGDKRKTTWTDSTPSPATAPYNGVPYFYSTKYTLQLGSTGGAITQYYMVLRLAEQYLIRAEARAQQGTNLSGAASDLNVLRTRAGLANTTAATPTALLTAVAHERQTELLAEWGHRWLDLKRTGQANTVLGVISTKQPWSANALLYPIPYTELNSDPNLVQNAGY